MNSKKIYDWDGFELSSGDVSVGITPSIGGRIMSLKYKGHEIFYVDPPHKGETFNPKEWTDLTQAKKALGFRLWGGDKTWVAPEKEWLLKSPSLDLDAAPYEIVWNKEQAVMTSPICRETGLQILRRVSVEDGKVHLKEELYNMTDKPLLKGLWNIDQVNRPCYFEIPANESFRSYHADEDAVPAFHGGLLPFHGDLSPKNGTLLVDCLQGNLFKVGGIPNKGELSAYVEFGNETVLWKKYFDFNSQDRCFAHRSMIEVYNSHIYPYAEIEIHAPFKVIPPHGSVQLKQVWQLSFID